MKASARIWIGMAAMTAGLALSVLQGCGVGGEIDRDPHEVAGIRIDSVKLVPTGSRFALRDSLTTLLFVKIHVGYACSRILELGLDSVATGTPSAYAPVSLVRLPGSADCALDSTGSDTSLTHTFRGADGWIRLANPAGKITDSAQLVAGSLAFDSLIGKFDTTYRIFSAGHYSVSDSGGGRPRSLFVDTLACGQAVNHAEYAPKGDSLKVRLSVVTLDAGSAPDSCRGPGAKTHSETVFMRPSR